MSDRPESPVPPAAPVPAGAHGGFAAAAQPLASGTVVHTSADGLDAGRVDIPAGGFRLPAYVARPAGAAPAGGWPVVLVVSEIFGLHEHIADVARRFAHQGYLAIAPDLFVRQGDPVGYTDIGRLMSEIVGKVPDAQVMSDLDAAVDWAGAHGGDLQRLGMTGFCWGGRMTWLYAAHQPRLKTGVAWYGRLQGNLSALQPRHPLDLTADLRAPVLALYGGQDAGIPLAQVDAMKVALAGGSAAAKASQFVVYPEAQHAFHADYRPAYLPAAAADGWRRCLSWLQEQGVR